MAEEDVKLPGGVSMDKRLMIAAVALTVGIVGYAWWKKRGSSADNTVYTVDPNDAFGAGDRVSPDGGGTDTRGEEGTPAIDTDEKWTQAATDYLVRLGYDPGAVSIALGKYLSRQKLKTSPVNELDIVRAARGAFGPPPRSGDIPIVADETTPPPQSGQGLIAPANLRVVGTTPSSVTLMWDPVPDARNYHVQLDGMGGQWEAKRDITESTTYTVGNLPKPNTEYTFTVTAKGNRTNGPDSVITGRTSS